MSTNQRLNDLYETWRQNNPGHFVGGGVIDEIRYGSIDVKLLFLLKEVNDSDQSEDWSLVDFIHRQSESARYHLTFEIIGLWSFGLMKGLPGYQRLIHSKEKNVREGLSGISITNLKKTGGTGVSELDEIRRHALDTKDLWIEEIKIMNPDVVVCGGTFTIVQEILGFTPAVTSSGTRMGQALGTIFIDFYHPRYRISPKVLYAYFKETFHSLGY